MTYETAVVIVVFMIVLCVAYGLTLLARGNSSERKMKHAEFNAKLPLDHEEDLLKIAANRDVEIAKATRKEPMRTIEHND